MALFKNFRLDAVGRREYAWRLTQVTDNELRAEERDLHDTRDGFGLVFGALLTGFIVAQAMMMRATNMYTNTADTSWSVSLVNLILVMASVVGHFAVVLLAATDWHRRWHWSRCRRLLLDEVSRREERNRQPKDCCGHPLEPDVASDL